jgi:hypothetical protein
MKATLEFTLPEETEEHRIAVNAGELYSAVDEVDHLLRNLIKHGDDRFRSQIELATYVREILADVKARIEP